MTNVVIMYADDLGYGDLGCYGSPTARTPNLDALARSGVRCTNWYSNSPVCSPSRASLLTGRYPQNAGVTTILPGQRGFDGLRPEARTLACRLKQQDFRTGAFGKWHLGTSSLSRPTSHGFDEYFGFLAGCVDYFSHIFYWGMSYGMDPVHDLWSGDCEVWRNGQYMTEVIGDCAVQFIEAQHGAPFFCYVPFSAPHYPMHAPQKYLDRFPGLSPERRVASAMIAAMDDAVGGVIDALQRTGAWQDTIVLFSSDHGPSVEARNWLDGTGDYFYGGSAGAFSGYKGSLLDGGLREPAIWSWPRHLPEGRVCDELGIAMDVLPTVMGQVTETPVGELGVDGDDVFDMLCGRWPTPHNQVFWAYEQQQAIRRGEWKLVLNGLMDMERPCADPVQLCNVVCDPGERVNLATAHPEIVGSLRAELASWQDSWSAGQVAEAS